MLIALWGKWYLELNTLASENVSVNETPCVWVCVFVCAQGGVHMELIGLVEGVNSTIGGVTYDARALFCSLLCRWDSNATERSPITLRLCHLNSSFQSMRTWGPHKRHGHKHNAASFIPKPLLVDRNRIFFNHFRWQILSKEEQPLPEPSSSSEREGSDLRKRRCARGAFSCFFLKGNVSGFTSRCNIEGHFLRVTGEEKGEKLQTVTVARAQAQHITGFYIYTSRKMSQTRIKKDKEIIAEYETQVKGM